MSYLTYHFRIRNRNAEKRLCSYASKVNWVWNQLNEAQRTSVKRYWNGTTTERFWFNEKQFQVLVKGVGQEIGLPQQSCTEIYTEYCKSRKQHKKNWLRWRSRKSLGWIPLTQQVIPKRMLRETIPSLTRRGLLFTASVMGSGGLVQSKA